MLLFVKKRDGGRGESGRRLQEDTAFYIQFACDLMLLPVSV